MHMHDQLHGAKIFVNKFRYNADKISKHLRKRGWSASKRTRGALRKYYESVEEYCTAYLLDNVVVFGFRFELTLPRECNEWGDSNPFHVKSRGA